MTQLINPDNNDFNNPFEGEFSMLFQKEMQTKQLFGFASDNVRKNYKKLESLNYLYGHYKSQNDILPFLDISERLEKEYPQSDKAFATISFEKGKMLEKNDFRHSAMDCFVSAIQYLIPNTTGGGKQYYLNKMYKDPHTLLIYLKCLSSLAKIVYESNTTKESNRTALELLDEGITAVNEYAGQPNVSDPYHAVVLQERDKMKKDYQKMASASESRSRMVNKLDSLLQSEVASKYE